MKKLLIIHIILSVLTLSCKTEKSESLVQQELAFLDILKSTDSIDCWGCQFTEYFDTSSMKLLGADGLIGGINCVTKDSIFSFGYPCFNSLNESYLVNGRNLIMPNTQTYRIKKKKDTLWLQGQSMGGWYYDSLEVITLDSYVKMRIPTTDLINSYGLERDTACWKNKKYKDCMMNWVHYDDIMTSFNEEYTKF